MVNGDRYKITHPDLDQIQRKMTAAQYPVLPGTFYLTYFIDDQGEEVFRSPVLGWREDGAGRIRPVIMKPGENECDDYAILFPSGLVEDVGGGSWESEESWLMSHRS